MSVDEWTSAELSKLLFDAREQVDMWADVVQARGADPSFTRDVVRRIDSYREARGWSAHGFGGENDPSLLLRLEFGFWGADTYASDMTRLTQALDALEAQGVIRYSVQLGFRAPIPDETDDAARAVPPPEVEKA